MPEEGWPGHQQSQGHCRGAQGGIAHQGQVEALDGDSRPAGSPSIAGYLPTPEIAFARRGLATVNGMDVVETIPHPADNEQVCFVPFLICGIGFPIHPF